MLNNRTKDYLLRANIKTHTKLSYDSKGVIIRGTNATTDDIEESPTKKYVTSSQLNAIRNISGINTGDQDLSNLLVNTNNLSDLTDINIARNNLSLGSLAIQNGTFSGISSGINTGDNAVNVLYERLITNANHTGDATGDSVLTVVGINGVVLSTLGTGFLKISSGIPSIADISDFPILNQNTTGTAANGIPTGGTAGQVLAKIDGSDYNTHWITGGGGGGSGDALTTDPLSQFAATTKAQLNSVISDGTPMYVGDAPTSHTHVIADITDFGTYSTDIHSNIAALNLVSGTNTGDQSTIVGITGTKSEFNTAITDGNFMYAGDAPTAHTHTISDITDFGVYSTDIHSNISALDLVSGTNTGDQDLSTLVVKSNNLSDLTNQSTARTNLGLGTLATQSGTFSGISSGTNTGDQTSIVGITGLKSQFNTALTDGDFMFIGDAPTSHTHVIADITDFGTYSTDIHSNITALNAVSGVNTGDQDLSTLLVKSNNLSDLTNITTARTNLGLGSLATQSGTFSGTSSGTNTGDQNSIVGITGTKTEFNTAVTDSDILFTNDITGTPDGTKYLRDDYSWQTVAGGGSSNIDGGGASSVYGGTAPIDGGLSNTF